MEIDNKLIDDLLKGYRKPEDIVGENGLLKQLTKALLERAMNAELGHHLGYDGLEQFGLENGQRFCHVHGRASCKDRLSAAKPTYPREALLATKVDPIV